MKAIKHVGRLINTDKRIVVVFRNVPGEPQNCLVTDTEALPDWIHDGLINAVESIEAQSTGELYDYLSRSMFSDGSIMLDSLHTRGLLQKQKTENVMMTPNANTTIRLDQLNEMIESAKSENKVAQSVLKEPVTGETGEAPASAQADGVLDDKALADQKLAQAKGFETEAARLREEAYELAPDLKPRRGRPAKK
tara:strand:+ start:8149 stop:8730 length:582 start_codon:yes stop_codon:yes gene_type:complete